MRDVGMIGAWLAMHAVIGLIGTALARRYAIRTALLDQPDARRSHAVATPRGGGIVFAVSGLIAMGCLLWWQSQRTALLLGGMVGLLLVAGVGWRDDHGGLSARIRLAAHVLAAAAVGIGAWLSGAPHMQVAIVVVAIPVLVNVWNFMDGIDGIAASQALLCALAITVVAAPSTVWMPALALAAVCAGFLPFNAPRARIFMGDVGSGSLGFLLAFTLVIWPQHAGASSLLLLAIPMSAFLLDASLTLMRRIVRGEPWWSAHVQHLYQRAARARQRHWPVTLAYAAWTLLGLWLAWLLQARAQGVIMAGVVGWYLMGTGIWWTTRNWHYLPMQPQGIRS